VRARGARRPVASILGLAGGLGALAVDVLYLMTIAQQGVTPPGGRVVFVAGWVAVAGSVGVMAAFVRRPSRRALMLGISAAMLFALAVPALFSFGIALMLCAAFVGLAALRAGEVAGLPGWSGLVGSLVLVMLAGGGVALGFAVTDF
jgi:hypothetical protein